MIETKIMLTFLFRTLSAFLRARVCNTIILATNCATSGDKLAPKLVGITT